ncbi:MAG: ADP-ribosylglycohydrolase family protein [Mycobacteriales bacterium]
MERSRWAVIAQRDDNGWVVAALLAAWSAINASTSYADGVSRAVNGGGDTDTVAAIARSANERRFANGADIRLMPPVSGAGSLLPQEHPLRLVQETNSPLTATSPNQLWVADVMYVSTVEGWLYRACLTDFSPG